MIEIQDKKYFPNFYGSFTAGILLTEHLTSFSERTTLTPESQTDLELELETTTENRRRRGYVKKRIRTGSRRTTESPQGNSGLVLLTLISTSQRNNFEP